MANSLRAPCQFVCGNSTPHNHFLLVKFFARPLRPLFSLWQVHPTSLVDPADPTNLSKFLAPEAMRGSGGIIVDKDGRRFANELTTRAILTEAIFKAGSPMPGDAAEGKEEGAAPTVACLMLNQEAADSFGTGVLGFYMSEWPTSQATKYWCVERRSCVAHSGLDTGTNAHRSGLKALPKSSLPAAPMFCSVHSSSGRKYGCRICVSRLMCERKIHLSVPCACLSIKTQARDLCAVQMMPPRLLR